MIAFNLLALLSVLLINVWSLHILRWQYAMTLLTLINLLFGIYLSQQVNPKPVSIDYGESVNWMFEVEQMP